MRPLQEDGPAVRLDQGRVERTPPHPLRLVDDLEEPDARRDGERDLQVALADGLAARRDRDERSVAGTVAVTTCSTYSWSPPAQVTATSYSEPGKSLSSGGSGYNEAPTAPRRSGAGRGGCLDARQRALATMARYGLAPDPRWMPKEDP